MVSDPEEAVEALRSFVNRQPANAQEFRIQIRVNKPAKFNLGQEIMDEVLSVEQIADQTPSNRRTWSWAGSDEVLVYEGRDNISERTLPIILQAAKTNRFAVVVTESGQPERGWLRGAPPPAPQTDLVIESGETYRLTVSNVRKAVPWFWVMLIPYLIFLGPLVEWLLLRNNFHMLKEIKSMASDNKNEVLDIEWNAAALSAELGDTSVSVPTHSILAFGTGNVITSDGFVRLPQLSERSLMAVVASALNSQAGMN